MPLSFLKVYETRQFIDGRITCVRRYSIAHEGGEPVGNAVQIVNPPGVPGKRYKTTVNLYGIRHVLEGLEVAKAFAEGVHLAMIHKSADENASKSELVLVPQI